MTITTARTFILSEAKNLDRAFMYRDMLDNAKGQISYGALRSGIYRLKKDGLVLSMPRERPSRFILANWKDRPEYAPALKCNKTPMGGRVKVVKRQLIVDFASFVESLDWEQLCHIHDVRVEFDCVKVDGVSPGGGWRWCSENHSWRRNFNLDYPLTVQVYDSGTVQVMVACSLHALPFSYTGLTLLTAVLSELKGILGWSNAPKVLDWIVTSWHYGKDSRKEVSGASLNVTFDTWSKSLARIYAKKELRKLRVEEIQSPMRSVQELFDEVLNRELM